MRVVIADDVLIVRAGLSRLLADAGVDVVAEAEDVESVLRAVDRERPDAAIVDIRMPPDHRNEGLVAAHQIRQLHPECAVLLLSEYLDSRYAERLLADQPEHLGYLLKSRVSEPAVLVETLTRLVAGESVVDPAIVERLMSRRAQSPVRDLTPRERNVLALMAEGRSNAGVAARLGIGERTVESMCAQIFRKLDVEADPDTNRRVVAVLKVLRPARSS